MIFDTYLSEMRKMNMLFTKINDGCFSFMLIWQRLLQIYPVAFATRQHHKMGIKLCRICL